MPRKTEFRIDKDFDLQKTIAEARKRQARDKRRDLADDKILQGCVRALYKYYRKNPLEIRNFENILIEKGLKSLVIMPNKSKISSDKAIYAEQMAKFNAALPHYRARMKADEAKQALEARKKAHLAALKERLPFYEKLSTTRRLSVFKQLARSSQEDETKDETATVVAFKA